jgi:hypothetical protein
VEHRSFIWLLSRRYFARQKKLLNDEHSSLLCRALITVKTFYNIDANVIKLLTSVIHTAYKVQTL